MRAVGRACARVVVGAVVVLLAVTTLEGTVTASNVAAGLGDERTLAVPTWLSVLTGAAAVGASGLLAALVTDRRFVAALHDWSIPLSRPRLPDRISRSQSRLETAVGATSRSLAVVAASIGVVLLGAVLFVGLDGPTNPTANLAVIVTFVGVRGLLPMFAFLVVNPWPAIDPFRTTAAVVSRGTSLFRSRAVDARVGTERSGGRSSDDDRFSDDGRSSDGAPPAVDRSAGDDGRHAGDYDGRYAGDYDGRRPDDSDARHPDDSGGRRAGGYVDRHATDYGLLEYPAALESWPAVIGLALLVWLELALPLTTDPATLAWVALGYTVYTVCGGLLFSPSVWFHRGDPLAVLFRLYGAVAPIQRINGSLRLVLPGSRLRDGDVVTDASEVAFVLLLVWELTFNGFVVTPPGTRTIDWLVGAGLAPPVAYLVVALVGYGLFLGGYLSATVGSRRVAPTFLTVGVLARRFAPPLLAIAAGYHLAHYVAFVLSLSPATVAVLVSPLSPPVNPSVLAVPGWMGALEVSLLLVGHLLAIWTAHAVAFDVFPGRLQAIRSQYPFVAVLICFTTLSLWLLTLPTAPPPYVGG